MLYEVVIDLKPEMILCNLSFFFNEKIQILKKIFFLPHGTYFAATSALNGSMDGKCNGCMELK